MQNQGCRDRNSCEFWNWMLALDGAIVAVLGKPEIPEARAVKTALAIASHRVYNSGHSSLPIGIFRGAHPQCQPSPHSLRRQPTLKVETARLPSCSRESAQAMR